MNKKERKLNSAELKRKEHYDKVCEKMNGLGYNKRDFTVGVFLINILSIFLTIPFVLAMLVLYFISNYDKTQSYSLSYGIMFIILIFLIVLHEAIHGLTFGVFTKNHLKDISFGVVWKALTPYCTCAEPLKRWQYILGAAMPTLILGFVMGFTAIAFNQLCLFLLSEIMIFAGGGDFFIIIKMLLYRPRGKNVLYYDHPYECGFVVFEKSDK